MSLESAQDIFDGDMSPSGVSDFKYQAESAQSGVLACASGYMSSQ
jgi:hypothetical protein